MRESRRSVNMSAQRAGHLWQPGAVRDEAERGAASGAIAPFQFTFFTWTEVPLPVSVPFQTLLIVYVLGRVSDAVQPPDVDVLWFMISTWPCIPPFQALTTLYVAMHPPPG